MRPVGNFEEEEPQPKGRARLLKPDTRGWVLNVWQREAGLVGRRRWNQGHLDGELTRLHKDHTWEEIEKMMRVFFKRYGQDIRAKFDVDLVRMFSQQLNQGLMKQAKTKQPRTDSWQGKQMAKTGAQVLAEMMKQTERDT